jgi:outer membrane protein assembly factor BamB
MRHIYSLNEKRLQIKDGHSQEVIWGGKPDGYPVLTVFPIPESDDCIVLLDFNNNTSRLKNVVRCKPDGTIAWRCQLPNSSGFDAYTSVAWTNQVIEAYSWSGFVVSLNIDNGNIMSSMFVK